MIALLLALLQPAFATEAELLVERARAALGRQEAPDARELAIRAVDEGAGREAWSVYLRSSRAVGLGPAAQAELEGLVDEREAVRVLWTVDRVRAGELQDEALVELARDLPVRGGAALAERLWERDARASALDVTPDAPDSDEIARVRLEITTATGELRLASVVGRAWLRAHPERPDVLTELWTPTEYAERFAPLRARTLKHLRRDMEAHWEDPLYLYRSAEVFQAAHEGATARRIEDRIVELGLEPPRASEGPEARLDQTAERVHRLLRTESFEDAVLAWETHRELEDGPRASLEHGRLLQLLEEHDRAIEVAFEALDLAAGPTPADLGCLDTATQSARLADGFGLLAELMLAVSRTRSGRQAAALARSLDPHPRWAALSAQAQALPDNPDDPGITFEPRVMAVVDTLVAPTRGDAWVARAGYHEAAGEAEAAFVAWAMAGVYGASVKEPLGRTWTGPGDAELAAAGVREAFNEARRLHRDRIAEIRRDDGAAPIQMAPTSPGAGLLLPPWEATGLDGEALTSSAFEGQPYVLTVWASWCAPCLLELPDLDEQISELRDGGKPAVALAISVDERQTIFRRKVEELGLRGLTMAWSPDLSAQIGVDGLPTTFAIGPDGRILHVEHGYSPAGVSEMVDRLAEEMR